MAATEKGRAEGIEKGKAEGVQEGKKTMQQNIALNMLKRGPSIEIIADST